MKIKEVKEKLQKGKFTLIHDSSDRENETDMILPADKAKPKHIAKMRKEAGGLICVAIHPKVSEKIHLPYLSEIYASASHNHKILNSAEANDLPYDERSAFSISVNHRDTFTGITDKDRALTISELGKLSSQIMERKKKGFGKNFRTPGHVPLLKAADDLLEKRKGHTELSIALMEMADACPAAVVCEMLDSETGKALSREKAREYSEGEELVWLDGQDIQQNYFNRKEV